MVSEKQIQANQQNARKSTGPKTVEGKAVVSMNSVKHGLLSKQLFRDETEEEEFGALAARFYAQLNPVNAIEELLVDRIVSNAWRLRRLLEVESLYQSYRVNCYRNGPYKDASGHVWSLIENLENVIEHSARLTRYESFLERSMNKALHELERLQAGQQNASMHGLGEDLGVSGVRASAKVLQGEVRPNGFVS